MIFAAEVVGGLVVALIAAGGVLRFRKLRRDSRRDARASADRRLVAPPPSPYAPSRGFRLVDDSGEPLARPPVQRPRLDPERHYVFSDSSTHNEDALPTHLRHSDDWFLSRSAHRSTASIVLRAVGVFVLVAIVIASVTAYYLDRGHKSSNGAPTTTTTTTTKTVTTTTAPSALRPISTSGEDATYAVPASRYRVTVIGALGETWTEYNMGPANTLEWQGAVDQGKDESLVMTGDSEVTLGSPSSAKVVVDGRPVVFPSPLPATLVLVFQVRSAGSTNSA